MTPADFTSDAQTILPELVELRRALHADPELGLTLPRTQQKVLDALEGLPLEITTGTRTSSVTAVLRGELPGPSVLLRGDMDALPIVEEANLDFCIHQWQHARLRPRSAYRGTCWCSQIAVGPEK